MEVAKLKMRNELKSFKIPKKKKEVERKRKIEAPENKKDKSPAIGIKNTFFKTVEVAADFKMRNEPKQFKIPKERKMEASERKYKEKKNMDSQFKITKKKHEEKMEIPQKKKIKFDPANFQFDDDNINFISRC